MVDQDFMQMDSADDGGNLLFDELGQAPLLKHGVRIEINLVLEKLNIVTQSLEIVRQEAPTVSDILVDLPNPLRSLGSSGKTGRKGIKTPHRRSKHLRVEKTQSLEIARPTPIGVNHDRRIWRGSAINDFGILNAPLWRLKLDRLGSPVPSSRADQKPLAVGIQPQAD